MALTILTVTYRLRVPVTTFREQAEPVAGQIAESSGLVWKIWGLDPSTGEGTSVYLFHDPASAQMFSEGPVIAALRDGPAEYVVIRIAPVDVELSRLSGATLALSERPGLPGRRRADLSDGGQHSCGHTDGGDCPDHDLGGNCSVAVTETGR